MLKTLKEQPVTCTLILVNLALALACALTGSWFQAIISVLVAGGLSAFL